MKGHNHALSLRHKLLLTRSFIVSTCIAAFFLQLSLASAGNAKEAQLLQAHDLLETWQRDAAIAINEQLLQSHPHNPSVLQLTARSLHQLGQHQTALALLQKAHAIAQNQNTPIQTLSFESHLRGSSAYADQWQTQNTPHFSIRFGRKDLLVAHYAQDVLEKTYAAIGQALGHLPAESQIPITVEIYPDDRGLASATGLSLVEIQTSGTTAVCKYNKLMITSPLARISGYGWAETLAHEFIHLVVSQKSHNTVPIWLHEGIAKYYESAWSGEPGRGLHHKSFRLLKQAVQNNTLLSLAQMSPSIAKLPSQELAALAFAQVFTLVGYIHTHFGNDAISKILTSMGQHIPLDKALKKHTGYTQEQLEKLWKKDLIQKTQTQDIALEKSIHSQVSRWTRAGTLLNLRQHTDAARIEYAKAWELLQSEQKKSGQEKSGSHRSWPQDLVLGLARTLVATDTHGTNKTKARKVLNDALRIKPGDQDQRLLAARLAIEAQAYTQAMQHLQAVIYRNPFNPNAHSLWAKIYTSLGQSQNAKFERSMAALAQTANDPAIDPALKLQKASKTPIDFKVPKHAGPWLHTLFVSADK